MPVRGSDGREYYVRYNDDKEELEEVPPPELRPLMEEDEAEAAGLAAGLRPQGIGAWEIAGEGLKGFGQGVVSGLGRVAGGATLGATDWLDRKTGGHLASLDADLQRSAESAGLGGWNKAAKFASELGGNMQGAGGALVKGLSKAGLKGLKLASASGGLEGAAYGATGSDSMDELPENVAWGAVFGAALPFGVHGVGRGARFVGESFFPRLMTAWMTGGLGNAADNPEAVKLLKQGIRNNDDVAEAYLNRVRPELRGINNEAAGMVGSSLSSRIDVPETIASEHARYGDYMARHGADEVMDFAPQVTRYRGGNDTAVLKSIRRNMEKQDPEFKFRLDEDGHNDYPHFLKDTQRAQYVETLPSTHNNPQQVIRSVHDGQNREYRLKQYYNPENQKSVYDMVINNPDDGRLVTKFAREGKTGRKEFEKVLKNRPESQVAGTGRGLGQAGQTPIPNAARNNNVPRYDIVVNSELPHVSSLYEGLFKRINNNSLIGKSLADEALKYENTLAQVLPGDVYDRLLQGLNRQSTKFGRLSELGQEAESRLKTPEGATSASGWINNLLRGRAIRRASMDLLNPNFVGRSLNNGWVVDNPALSAGLSSATYNNMRNR